MKTLKRSREKSVLSKQEIAARRKVIKQQQPISSWRAIVGISMLALSVLCFLALATFHTNNPTNPESHNAIGPVGYAVANALRSILGITAFALPILGMYSAGILFVSHRKQRRWSQILSLGLLLLCASIIAQLLFSEDPNWTHAPGGSIGRELTHTLTSLLSTIGTVIVVSAVAIGAFIIGTQFAILRFFRWVWKQVVVLASQLKTSIVDMLATQQAKAEERYLAQEEETELLQELEALETELPPYEAASKEAQPSSLEKERKQAARDENTRSAREALKMTRTNERMSPTGALAQPVVRNADPAWTKAFQATPFMPEQPNSVLKLESLPKRAPNIVELPQAMPVEPQDNASEKSNVNQFLTPASGNPMQGAQKPVSTSSKSSALLPHFKPTPLIVEPQAPPKPTVKKKESEFEFHDGRTSFAVPPMDVLAAPHREQAVLDKGAFLITAEKLSAKLKDFGIEGEVVEIRPGPVVTIYEFKPAAGVKISRIASLSDDLAMAMEAMRVRIVAPIPGKGVVGIEVPNKHREGVFLKEIAEQDSFQKPQSKLTMCLGKDIEGLPYILDLAKAPHLLMAGTTGSGKSVAVNAMIMSMLLKSTPEEVRFIMVDPKMLELSVYEGIPHLLLPVVTNPRKAAVALQWAVEEMTRRYKLLSEAGVRNINGYNAFIDSKRTKEKSAQKSATLKPQPSEQEKSTSKVAVADCDHPKKKRRMLIVDAANENEVQTCNTMAAAEEQSEFGVAAPVDALENPRENISAAPIQNSQRETEIRVSGAQMDNIELEEKTTTTAKTAEMDDPQKCNQDATPEELKKLPYIVVIIDELADLMMVASKEVETSIARLAQMARAAGIHLMVATQRPSTDVVTGVIKANFPTRISFMLRSKPDSMTILGTVGAEALLGMGDMLIMPPTSAHLQRVHGCFVSENEIKRAVDHLKAQGKPNYDESILKPREDEAFDETNRDESEDDELYDQAVSIVSEMRQVSISMLQRKMRIGYNRSARLIECMERNGIVGPADGVKPREVLIRQVGEMPSAGML